MKKLLVLAVCLAGFMFATFSGPGAVQAKERTLIKFETTLGDFYILVDNKKAPKTSENFIKYVEDGFYDGTVFHRVIENFMIQGGGMDAGLEPKETRAPVVNEADNGLKNDKYTVAMARTNEPHSATAQFFINVKNNDFLNHKGKTMSGWGYAVFGKVVKGQDVVDKIRAVPTRTQGFHEDVPTIPVVIKSAQVVDGVDEAS